MVFSRSRSRVLAHMIPLLLSAGAIMDVGAESAEPSVATVQPDPVDVGSFTIQREGVRVGREQFSLRQVASPEGVEF